MGELGVLYRTAPLVVLFVVYWATSITSHLNIGHRHILPTYPVLFIAAGALGTWLVSRRALLVAAVVALLVHGTRSLLVDRSLKREMGRIGTVAGVAR